MRFGLDRLNSSQRVSRQETVKIANSVISIGILYSAGDSVPFDPGCKRILDGPQDTNNPTAKGWFDKDSFKPDAMGIPGEYEHATFWTYIHSIDPRSIVGGRSENRNRRRNVHVQSSGKREIRGVPGVGKFPCRR